MPYFKKQTKKKKKKLTSKRSPENKIEILPKIIYYLKPQIFPYTFLCFFLISLMIVTNPIKNFSF